MTKISKILGVCRIEIVKMKDGDIPGMGLTFKFFSFLSELNNK